VSQDNQQPCWTFQNLYLIRDSWTSYLLVGILLGLIIVSCSYGLELMGFSYVWNGNECFPDVSQRRLPRILLDHFPLMLDCSVLGGGSRHFLNLKMCLKVEDFVEQVKTWWLSFSFQGSPTNVLAYKLKDLKLCLKKWNGDVFGNVGKKKKDLMDGIWELDFIVVGGSLNEEGIYF